MRRRVVITGIGVVSPIGIGKEEFWTSLSDGRSGVDRLTRFCLPECPCQVAAEVKGFDPILYMNPHEARRMDAIDQYAVAAARLAINDARLAVTIENRFRIGVVIGTSLYGVAFGEGQHAIFRKEGLKKTSPYTAIAIFPCSPMGFVSIDIGVTGWSNVVSTCASSGTDAIGHARDAIEAGYADAIIAGGTEAPLTPAMFLGLDAAGALSHERNGRSRAASRPFDRGRDGFVLGEGAGMVLLEGEDHARARGARIYAEVLGYGTAFGSYDFEGLGIDLKTAEEAISIALDDAGCHADNLDLIFANAASEMENDRIEASLLRQIYDGACPPVTSIRSMVGQTLGASGGLQAAACSLAIDRSYITPTINYHEPDPDCRVDTIVTKGKTSRIRLAAQHSFGYLGTQSVLIIREFGRR
jgi:3-oxoacyl-[acyl-carrier-protein] synthase II